MSQANEIETVKDFNQFLNENGFNADFVRKRVEMKADQIPMPSGDYKISISDSKIEGQGVFSTDHIEPGEIIGPARLDGKRTPIGRFCNHSKNPNARMEPFGEDLFLVASSEINAGTEVVINYRNNLKLSGVVNTQQAFLSELEAQMLLLPQMDFPIEHEFSDGVYCRKMFAKAGTLVLGKRHRMRTLNILLSGEVTVYAGNSMPVKRIKAPKTFVSDAMTRKLLFFHYDSVFANIHPTIETDLDKIEKQFIIPEPEYIKLLEKEAEKCLG